ncbi:hypothetical protein MNEG_11591 [Monoraphidium neglectum]|uniref:Uncharacterized protein n=1 Tax=Monoraphidium neglectum TaxID=145388 RepID=A0A0D2M516_9CHLO|nr:hypothetical protein MNEG_11591 [Monoraphidium neglectum]KIY96371.1 hypothetical protein MNEG_11591 [Monoraphidium neglectum]|eukprot:XP_013895391.1 hypothetical protein MNEG_11591 [Monoraphidium neglectum]
MQLPEVQALIGLAELGARSPYPLRRGVAALLRAAGAGAAAAAVPRSDVPDVLPAAAALAVLQTLPIDAAAAARLPAAMALEGAGFGAEGALVQTDALAALLCLVCGGGLDEKLDLAFWVLDSGAAPVLPVAASISTRMGARRGRPHGMELCMG